MTLLTRRLVQNFAAISLIALVGGMAVAADDDKGKKDKKFFQPENLVVSRSVYDNQASNVAVGTVLPPNCKNTTGKCGKSSGAPFNGLYPAVWNNDSYDGSFGITSKIFLDQITIHKPARSSIRSKFLPTLPSII